jgi:hypothetical protein
MGVVSAHNFAVTYRIFYKFSPEIYRTIFRSSPLPIAYTVYILEGLKGGTHSLAGEGPGGANLETICA